MKTKLITGIFLWIFLGNINLNGQLTINEIFLTNGSKYIGSDYNYPNWIELYNYSDSDINTSGFYLSNDSSNFELWPLPNAIIQAHGYVAYLLTGRDSTFETNFKADADKDTFYLSNNSVGLIQTVVGPKQYYNVSYGRIPDGTGGFVYNLRPTFSSGNNSDTASGRSVAVSFDKGAGFYDNPIDISIINSSGQGTIYYTIDGSEPDSASSVYTASLNLTKTTVLRARLIEKNKVPGSINSATYFIAERKPLVPVISLITDPKNLFNDTIGIYVRGVNGKISCGGEPANWNQDWERPGNLEYFDVKNNRVVNQMLGFRIAGACTRNFPQKSLAFTARSKYGKDRIEYKFFNNRNFKNFNSILARTGANDWYSTLCRDAMLQSLANRFMHLEHQSVQPSVMYINGEYYGIQHTYERSGDDLIEAIYGLKEDQINLGERNGIPLNGSTEEYNSMMAFIKNNSLADQANYNHVDSLFDIDNFMEYLIFEIYIDNNDWPGSNIKFWQSKTPGSKWRWILYDVDFGFGLYQNVHHESLAMMFQDNEHVGYPNPEWSTRLFRKLLENPEYKRKFLSRFYTHINTTFKQENVAQTIDSITDIFKDEAPFHFNRWNTDGRRWAERIQELKDYNNERQEVMRSHLRQHLGAGGNINVTCHSVAPGYGYIGFDGVVTNDTAFNGIFAHAMVVQVSFVPAPGYTFYKAERTSDNQTKEIFAKNFLDTLNADVSYTLYFEKNVPLADLIINEVAARNKIFADEFNETDDWIEIYNKGSDTTELSGLYLSDSMNFPAKYRIPYQEGNAVVINPGGYKIIWADNQPQQGPLHANFKLKADGEQIGLFQKIGEEFVVLDNIDFEGLTGKYFSFGRMPNITGMFKKLSGATPLAENMDNLVDVTETILSVDESKIWYQSSTRTIQIQNSNQFTGKNTVTLRDLNGHIVLFTSFSGDYTQIDVSGFKKGLYFVTINSKTSVKVMVY